MNNNCGDEIPDRERDCLRDGLILENVPLATPPPVSHDGTETTASVGQLGDESRAPSLCFGQVPSAPEKAEVKDKAHTRLSWWLPEILSQVVGMLCLLGRFDTLRVKDSLTLIIY